MVEITRAFVEPTPSVESWPERLGPGAVLLHGFAAAAPLALAVEVARIIDSG